MVYKYRRIPLTVFVHCYNVNPAVLRNECRMKTNQRSRPVKKNRPVKDIYIIYIGRARIVPRLFLPSAPCACALSPSEGVRLRVCYALHSMPTPRRRAPGRRLQCFLHCSVYLASFPSCAYVYRPVKHGSTLLHGLFSSCRTPRIHEYVAAQ